MFAEKYFSFTILSQNLGGIHSGSVNVPINDREMCVVVYCLLVSYAGVIFLSICVYALLVVV